MKTKFTVPEISCGHCKETIEAAINTIDSVENVSVNIDNKLVEVMSNNEIDMAGLQDMSDVQRENIKPQVDEYVFPDGHSVIILSEGRLLNLGNATGHPSFVMSFSFTNQVMAQIDLYRNAGNYQNQVITMPKSLDEKVARLHLESLGVRLSELSQEQADYLGIPKEGPFKPEHYRY